MGIKILTIIAVVLCLAVAAAAATGAPAPKDTAKAAPSSVTETAARGMAWVLLAAVLGMAFAAAGAAIGQAVTANAALQGIARQPEASGKLFMPMILTVIFIETLAIYTLVVALLLIFVNPLKGLLG
jgi:F-type H+-transporting ATPase subunit c